MRRSLGWLAASGAAAFALLAYVWITLPDVRPLARSNPTTTAFMELRAREAREKGRPARRIHRWVPYSRISQNLKRAVLVAEDSAFFHHEGLDYEEIRKSIEIAFESGGEIRGASTITQQLAKNLYLSPSRNPLRKVQELIIARRLEASLPKGRIFEIYLNVVEWGDGIWGADAAARTYFGVPASAVTPEQAALLAGALINPIVYSPGRPPARLLRRQRIILSRMGIVEPPAPVPMIAPPSDVPDESDEGVPPVLLPPDSERPDDPALPTPEPPPDEVPPEPVQPADLPPPL